MVKPFGMAHPLDAVVGPLGYGVLATVFVASVCLSVAIGIHATRARHLRRLRPFILLSELVFPAGEPSRRGRALVEMLLRPFWWAKTTHGGFGGVRGPAAPGLSGSPDPAPLPSGGTTKAMDR